MLYFIFIVDLRWGPTNLQTVMRGKNRAFTVCTMLEVINKKQHIYIAYRIIKTLNWNLYIYFSNIIVTGPSFNKLTFMSAPKIPF